MIDKYVEIDAVILLLDVLLLRIESYRHLIFNYGIDFAVSQLVSRSLEIYTQLRLILSKLPIPGSMEVYGRANTM